MHNYACLGEDSLQASYSTDEQPKGETVAEYQRVARLLVDNVIEKAVLRVFMDGRMVCYCMYLLCLWGCSILTCSVQEVSSTSSLFRIQCSNTCIVLLPQNYIIAGGISEKLVQMWAGKMHSYLIDIHIHLAAGSVAGSGYCTVTWFMC